MYASKNAIAYMVDAVVYCLHHCISRRLHAQAMHVRHACSFAKSSQMCIQKCCVVRYDTVAKLGITASKQHLQTTFPDGIPLESAFISPSVIHQLDASAEDAVTSGSWCDVQALLPPALTHEDMAAVLEHCSVMQSSGKFQTLAVLHLLATSAVALNSLSCTLCGLQLSYWTA